MFRKTGTTLDVQQKKKPKLRRNKIVLGFAGALTAAVMGSAGVAAAHPAPRTMYMPTRETCNQQWQKYHFKNGNDCRNYWDNYKHHHPSHKHGNKPSQGGDNGYGGNGGGVTVIINNNGGSGNVIVVIINYFRGNG